MMREFENVGGKFSPSETGGTVPGVAAEDVVAVSEQLPLDVIAREDALIRALAIQNTAEMIFEFGPNATNIAQSIVEDGDGGAQGVVTDQSRAGTMPPGRSPSELAPHLKPEAITRTDVIRHVDVLHGDGARLQFALWLEGCDLVIVDAAKTYESAKCDTLTALHLAKPGGVVVWRYYGMAPGVTTCLNELFATDPRLHSLQHIIGTSLCLWRRPQERD